MCTSYCARDDVLERAREASSRPDPEHMSEHLSAFYLSLFIQVLHNYSIRSSSLFRGQTGNKSQHCTHFQTGHFRQSGASNRTTNHSLWLIKCTTEGATCALSHTTQCTCVGRRDRFGIRLNDNAVFASVVFKRWMCFSATCRFGGNTSHSNEVTVMLLVSCSHSDLRWKSLLN